MRIFLDFDGVLHRESFPKSRLDADCLRNLELAVLTHSEVRVVITSTWRLVHGLDGLRGLFSPEFGARIEGATPDLPEVEGYPRHAEVQAYLATNRAPDPLWIAIDDDAGEFHPQPRAARARRAAPRPAEWCPGRESNPHGLSAWGF